MSDPNVVQREELPVCAVSDGTVPETPFAIVDVRGQVRKRFATMEEAQKIAEKLNAAGCELMQPDIHDTGTGPVQEEQEKPPAKAKPKTKPKAKAKAKSKGKSMPRGIPNKKRAVKKSAPKKSVVKKAAAVNKTAKKTAKKTTKRRKKK